MSGIRSSPATCFLLGAFAAVHLSAFIFDVSGDQKVKASSSDVLGFLRG
jgi:hypothetical protein